MLLGTLKIKCHKWIDSVLKTIDTKNILSFCFLLYEGKDDFHLQLIGSDTKPEDDLDWACSEVFTTGEDVYKEKRTITGKTWQEGLNYFSKIIQEYLDNGKYRKVLLESYGVGIGFVDGDIEVIYSNKEFKLRAK